MSLISQRGATLHRGCSAGLCRIPPSARELTRASGRDNPPISRPKVLIVTPHPVIGAGIETVLRLEDLYDLRRVGSLTDAVAEATGWPADAALIDGVLIEPGWTDIGVPSYVLSGDAESGERLAAQIGATGWLPKDAPPAQLLKALDSMLGIVRLGAGGRGFLGLLVAVVIVLAFIGALGLFLYRFFLR